MTILTCRDFMKVHRRLRIPSERFRSFTRRMTRKSLKNVTDTLMFSVDFTVWERKKEGGESGHQTVPTTYIFCFTKFNSKSKINSLQLPAWDPPPAETIVFYRLPLTNTLSSKYCSIAVITLQTLLVSTHFVIMNNHTFMWACLNKDHILQGGKH